MIWTSEAPWLWEAMLIFRGVTTSNSTFTKVHPWVHKHDWLEIPELQWEIHRLIHAGFSIVMLVFSLGGYPLCCPNDYPQKDKRKGVNTSSVDDDGMYSNSSLAHSHGKYIQISIKIKCDLHSPLSYLFSAPSASGQNRSHAGIEKGTCTSSFQIGLLFLIGDFVHQVGCTVVPSLKLT